MVSRKTSQRVFAAVCLIIILICSFIQFKTSAFIIGKQFSRFVLNILIIFFISIVLDLVKFMITSLFTMNFWKNRFHNARKHKIPFNKKRNDREYSKIVVSSNMFNTLLEDKFKNRDLNVQYHVKLADMIIFLAYFAVLIMFITHYEGEYELTYIARKCLLERRQSRYGLKQLHTITEVYDYLENTIIEMLYEDEFANKFGTYWPNLEMTKLTTEVYLVQNRYNTIKDGDKPVYLKDDFSPGWKPHIKVAGEDEDKSWRVHNPWVYIDKQEGTWLVPEFLMGRIFNYPSTAGYYAYLAKTKAESLKIFQHIKENNWLDINTAVVSILFTIYNVDLNVFMSISLIVEQTPFGNIVTHDIIEPLQLLPYVGDLELSYLLFVAIYALCLFSMTEMLIQRSINTPDFFRSFWNYVDMITVLLNALSIAFLIAFYETGQKLKADLRDFSEEGVIEFQITSHLFYANKVIFCMLLYISVVRLSKMMMVWENFQLFAMTLHKAMGTIGSYMIIVPTFLFGFALSFRLVKGDYTLSFVHMFPSMGSTLLMGFGFDIYRDDELDHMTNFIDLFIFGLLLFTLKLILANMLGSIICDYFVEANITKDKSRAVTHLSFTDFLKMQFTLKHSSIKTKKAIMVQERKRKIKKMLADQKEKFPSGRELAVEHDLKMKHLENIAKMFESQVTLITNDLDRFLDEQNRKQITSEL